MAVADPANLHGLDELRLATRHPLELGVASREDILLSIRKLVRASEASGARAAVDDEELFAAEEAAAAEDLTDLEAEDGVSDVPLVRLVNSIIFQAAEDGASDIHFEPQEDVARRARSASTACSGGAAHPEAAGERRHDASEGAREARHRRAAEAAGRPHLAQRGARRAACSTSASRRLPTVDGESIVMRLLDKSKKPPTLEELGLSEAMQAKIVEIIRKPDRRAARDRADRLR